MVLEARDQPQHPEGLTPAQEALADSLFEIGAIKFGSFELALHRTNPDAPKSPYYIDLRVLSLHPQAMKDAAKIYAQTAQGSDQYDICLGVPEAGNPLATAFMLETGTPQGYLRKEEKVGHGIPGRFLTDIPPGSQILLIDDLVTDAGSKIETIETLEASGHHVKDVVVLVDREQGGAGQLAERGHRLHASYGFGKLLDYYNRVGKVDTAKYDEAKAYYLANKR